MTIFLKNVPTNPRLPYGINKLTHGQQCLGYLRLGSMDIPKVRYSEQTYFCIPGGLLIQNEIGFVNLNICSIIPKVRYSEGSLFRQFVIPKVPFPKN